MFPALWPIDSCYRLIGFISLYAGIRIHIARVAFTSVSAPLMLNSVHRFVYTFCALNQSNCSPQFPDAYRDVLRGGDTTTTFYMWK